MTASISALYPAGCTCVGRREVSEPHSEHCAASVKTIHCPSCAREVRVTEPYAFGGRDRLRSTLACGHVVARNDSKGV